MTIYNHITTAAPKLSLFRPSLILFVIQIVYVGASGMSVYIYSAKSDILFLI
jgi:hypothetical protein